ncbi:MAG: hypothetical protein ACLFPV_13065 [Spirochaetaceae bacterium]
MTEPSDWLTLDNAAKIYPSSNTEEAPQVFRLRCDFLRPIRYEALEEALAAMMKRCPYFQVSLKRGLFWYYLQRHDAVPPIRLLDEEHITPIRVREDQHLLSVKIRGNRLAVDFSHVLTDGAGGLRFLLSLLTVYLRRRGESVESPDGFLDPDSPPGPEEAVDAHKASFVRSSPAPAGLDTAFHLPGKRPTPGYYRIVTGILEVDALRSKAKSAGVSMTEYIVASYIWTLLKLREGVSGRRASAVRIEVPVNMRPIQGTDTMRNFSLFVSPSVDTRLGDFSFEELLPRIHHTMRSQLDRKELLRQIGRNVRGELNPIVRIMPLFAKDLLLSVMHKRLGPSLYSGVVSNLGPIRLPPSVEEHVDSFRFFLGPSPEMKTNCSVLSFGGKLYLSVGNVLESRDFERTFFYHLRDQGLTPVITEE